MIKIKEIRARQIFDSRGKPTIEVDALTSEGRFRASVPSGASTGKYEAKELRDNDEYYCGNGVSKAISKIKEEIVPMLLSKVDWNVTQQWNFDNFLISIDGSEDKSRLGANSILGVSLSIARAGAYSESIPLYRHISNLLKREFSGNMPIPMLNVINGGLHAANILPFQEFMIVPVNTSSFVEAMRISTEVYSALKGVIVKKYGKNSTSVGDEGGFAPPMSSPVEALDAIMEAVSLTPHDEKVRIALDVAASEMYQNGKYNFGFKEDGVDDIYSSDQLLQYYVDLVNKYPKIISIEDPFDQDDVNSWKKITSVIGLKVCIVGDDLTVSSPKRVQFAAENKLCNSLILKMNQIGTLTETIEAASIAHRNGITIVVSHRSGETEDDFISDLAVGIGAKFLKA